MVKVNDAARVRPFKPRSRKPPVAVASFTAAPFTIALDAALTRLTAATQEQAACQEAIRHLAVEIGGLQGTIQALQRLLQPADTTATFLAYAANALDVTMADGTTPGSIVIGLPSTALPEPALPEMEGDWR